MRRKERNIAYNQERGERNQRVLIGLSIKHKKINVALSCALVIICCVAAYILQHNSLESCKKDCAVLRWRRWQFFSFTIRREKKSLQLAVKFTVFGQEPYHHPSRKLPLPRANRSHCLSLYIAGDICCCDIVYACMLFRFSITSLSMVSWCLFSWVFRQWCFVEKKVFFFGAIILVSTFIHFGSLVLARKLYTSVASTLVMGLNLFVDWKSCA